MLSTTEHVPFINNFEEYFEKINTDKATKDLNIFREKALKKLQSLQAPSTKDEDFKYTDISQILKEKFAQPEAKNVKESAFLKEFTKNDAIRIVFVNGIFAKELSQNIKHKGLTVLEIKEALTTNAADITAFLKKQNYEKDTYFLSLNKTLLENGVFIKVDDKVIFEGIIHIIHLSADASKTFLTSPYTMILCGKSSEITVLESHISESDTMRYLANALTEIDLSENAIIHYCKAQRESAESFHIGNTRIYQQTNSNFDGFSVMSSGKITRNNMDVYLNGEGTASALNGFYFGRKDQVIDNHTNVEHLSPNCTSNQLYKGILNDASRGIFNGKIYVHPIAQKTNSYQLNKTMLLGKDARIDTKPQLEIFADDVKCTHGATIGQMNEDEIFYFQSRCVCRRDAVRMLSKGFIEDILSTIKNEVVHDKLITLLAPTFASL